jgi:hypothetical protein
VEEIKSHPFFKSVNWDSLSVSTPPILPNFSVEEAFPDVERNTTTKHMPTPRAFSGNQLQFVGFTFTRQHPLRVAVGNDAGVSVVGQPAVAAGVLAAIPAASPSDSASAGAPASPAASAAAAEAALVQAALHAAEMARVSAELESANKRFAHLEQSQRQHEGNHRQQVDELLADNEAARNKVAALEQAKKDLELQLIAKLAEADDRMAAIQAAAAAAARAAAEQLAMAERRRDEAALEARISLSASECKLRANEAVIAEYESQITSLEVRRFAGVYFILFYTYY